MSKIDPTTLDTENRVAWFRSLTGEQRERFTAEARGRMAELGHPNPSAANLEVCAAGCAANAWAAKNRPAPPTPAEQHAAPRERAPLAHPPSALPVPSELAPELRALIERARCAVVSPAERERLDAGERGLWAKRGCEAEIDLVQTAREECCERGRVVLTVIGRDRLHVGSFGTNVAWVQDYATARAYTDWLHAGNCGDPTDWRHCGRVDRHYDYAERAAGAHREG